MKNLHHISIPLAMAGLVVVGRNDLAILAFALQGAAYIISQAIRGR